MEVIMENVRQYVLALMKAGDFSQKDLDDAIYLLFHVNFPDSYPLH